MQLTQDQYMIRDSAAQYLSDHCTPHTLQALTADQRHGDTTLWQAIQTELGWTGVLIPHTRGGLDLGISDMCLILEQAGLRLLNAPLWSHAMMSVLALRMACEDSAHRWLNVVADGASTWTMALPIHGLHYDLSNLPLLVAAPDGYTVSGHWDQVPYALDADYLILPVRRPDHQFGLIVIAAQQTQREPLVVWDISRPIARVSIDGCPLKASELISHDNAYDAIADVICLSALGQAAELLGIAARCLELTVAYTKERVQFGRAVAGFQAVKHRCAQMMVHIEATRSAVMGASVLANHVATLSTEQRCDIAAAVSLAKDTAFFCAQECIQLHGGVGFTWEYEPHFYFKRAQASVACLGTPEHWRELIAAAYLAAEV